MTDSLHQDAADLAEDARRLLLELDREVPGVSAISTECRPPLDVVETTHSVEVVVDVPGVAAESLRVAVRRSTLLVIGAKVAPRADGSVRFHVAERSYGRFARAVRIAGAFDSRLARATAQDGQLRVVFPRLADRRGEVMLIPVNTP